jgi:two-component system nitrogen regulation response regulator NtrX
MSLKAQAKILRILQEKKFERVGGNKVIDMDVRVLAATNKDLEKEMEAGRFRQDLYYRLHVIPLRVPPLRERKEDIPFLVERFLKDFAAKEGQSLKTVSDGALEKLMAHDWPGNVRELKNIIERILVLNGNGSIINEQDLPAEIICGKPAALTPDGEIKPFKEAIEELERQLLAGALGKAGGNQSQAAEMLRTTRRVVRYKARKYNLDT